MGKKEQFNKWMHYGKTEAIHNQDAGYLKTLINTPVIWEPKRDGSNISIMYRKGFLLIYTRNQLANDHVQGEVKGLIKEFEPRLKELLRDRYIIYMELLRKGKSPAGFEVNDEASILAFDLYDTLKERFIKPEVKYQLFIYFKIPHIVPMGQNILHPLRHSRIWLTS